VLNASTDLVVYQFLSMPMIPNGTSSSVVHSQLSYWRIHSFWVWHMTNIISRHAFSSIKETNSTRHFLGTTVKNILSNQLIWTNRCTRSESSQRLLSTFWSFLSQRFRIPMNTFPDGQFNYSLHDNRNDSSLTNKAFDVVNIMKQRCV
jgi:hypothetical protein